MKEVQGFLIGDKRARSASRKPRCPTCGIRVAGISAYVEHKKREHERLGS